MGRKSKKAIPRDPQTQKAIKSEPCEFNKKHSDGQCAVFIKSEDPAEDPYPQTEFYEVVMLDADSVKEEYAPEDQDEKDHEPEEQEISYHLAGPPKLCSKCLQGFPIEEFASHDCLAVNDPQSEDEISYHLVGPPKMCSTCLEAFPIEEFPNHSCRDINADKYPCKICPRKFRYKSLLVVHLKSHLRLQKGERIPELEATEPEKTKTEKAKHNLEFNYSPTPRWKLSRRRAEMMKRSELRVKQKLCHYCPIAFSNESHLEKHLRDHHGDLNSSTELIIPDANFDSTDLTCVKLENEETA
ncbi:zinc finger protein 234 [Drosophila biarmipes]|uniref:zinc finger protein 234 n=1 Tax=Drosophila biarmipes TaxID=125945 RepID=UPI0007E5E10C|nr:zinc finger protein 234 [Drosophila biarmipes]XP_043951047.1 zinc finger protein 234 [Drosophila biarmipes]